MKVAFLFPGQGAQQVGMGMDVAEKYDVARDVFNKADEVLGFSISKLIKEGPPEELKQTINTQPAIVTTSIALLEVLKSYGIECGAVAGHSVGEYAALYGAGVLDLESCVKVTRARGEYMHEAGGKNPGTLYAIIGLDEDTVQKICDNVDGLVVIANLNCPGQIVISGEVKAVEEAGRKAEELGARKVVPLAVSAAFHSPLMEEAASKLAQVLDSVNFADAKVPVYSNVSAEPVKSGEKLRELMKRQIISQVLWEKAMRNMIADGFDTFIEIGPGRTLAGMMRRIDRKVKVYNFNNVSSLDKILKEFSAVSAK